MDNFNDQKPVLIGLFQHRASWKTCRRIVDCLELAAVHLPAKKVSAAGLPPAACSGFEAFGARIRQLFVQRTPIIALCATGIVVRALAPLLQDKYHEPPVVVVAEDGSCIIPVLGGHRGANRIAGTLGHGLHVSPAITTASDVVLGFALDAPPPGWKVGNHAALNPLMTRLIAGDPVQLESSLDTDFPPREIRETVFVRESRPERVTITDCALTPTDQQLLLHPPSLVCGIGCARGCSEAELSTLVEQTLAAEGLSPDSLAAIASVTLKADEPALHALAARYQLSIRLFTPAELEARTPFLDAPAQAVFDEIGCHSVSEAAAIACVGDPTNVQKLVVKAKTPMATVSIVRRRTFAPLQGPSPGELRVVGIGPGAPAQYSQALLDSLSRCTLAIGYGLYLDLIAPLLGHCQTQPYPLGDERDRVVAAIDAARHGTRVALVCSGDPGIYAMATLVYEELDRAATRPNFRLLVQPGITAMQATSARVGAALGHDFVAISLSDLLTPIAQIRKRLQAAAEGDFVTAFYNPQSTKRRTLLAEAQQLYLQHRPPTVPVVIGRNVGRDDESLTITTLAEFQPEDVDMLSLVIFGSSSSRISRQSPQAVYTPRGYFPASGESS